MFGSRLKAVRQLRGHTQESLADAAGTSITNIKRWESERVEIKAEQLTKLAHALEVSTDYLLGLVDDINGHLTFADLSPEESRLISAIRGTEIIEAMRLLIAFSEVEK